MSSTGVTHVYQNQNGIYMVLKNIKGSTVNFGGFKSLDEAEMHRDYCVENDWSCDCIKRKRPVELKNIKKLKTGSYIVYNYVDYQFNYFGCFNSLKDAIAERDLLRECNWDYDEFIGLDEAEGTL